MLATLQVRLGDYYALATCRQQVSDGPTEFDAAVPAKCCKPPVLTGFGVACIVSRQICGDCWPFLLLATREQVTIRAGHDCLHCQTPGRRGVQQIHKSALVLPAGYALLPARRSMQLSLRAESAALQTCLEEQKTVLLLQTKHDAGRKHTDAGNHGTVAAPCQTDHQATHVLTLYLQLHTGC